MNSTNHSQFGSSQEGKKRSPLAFRFSKERGKNVEKASPFTEMPDELKGSRLTFGGLLRRVLNILLMTILVAALLALVAAFAYQMLHNPEMLAEASYNMVNTMREFLRSLAGTGT